MTPVHLGIAALLSGLLALERKAFLQAMLSRPLVAGTLLGLAFGRPVEGLAIGAGLELFYLGAVNLGAALPDNELLTTVMAVSCASGLAAEAPLPLLPTLACATLAALPAAKLGRLTDRLSERLNGWVASLVEDEGDDQRIRTGLRHNLYGLWMPFLSTAAAALAGAAIGVYLLPRLIALGPAAELTRALSFAYVAFLVVAAAVAARMAHATRGFAWAMLAALLMAGVQVVMWGRS